MDKQILENYLDFLNEVTRWKKGVVGAEEELENKVNQLKERLRKAKTPQEKTILSARLKKWTNIINQKGKLSDADLDYIKRRGIAKSGEQYRSGLQRGAENMFAKTNTIRKKLTPVQSHGISIDPMVKKGHIYHDPYTWKGGQTGKAFGVKSREEWKKLKPYVDYHEAQEASYSKKLAKKYGVKSGAVTFKKHPFDLTSYGQHRSGGVIKKEKEVVDYANRLYGDAAGLKKYRLGTGEYDTVKNLSYKQISKFDKKHAAEQLQKLYDQFLKQAGGDRKKALELLRNHNQARRLVQKYGPSIIKGLKITGAVALAAAGVAGAYHLYKQRKEQEALKKKGK